jgi:hypothetical protein
MLPLKNLDTIHGIIFMLDLISNNNLCTWFKFGAIWHKYISAFDSYIMLQVQLRRT